MQTISMSAILLKMRDVLVGSTALTTWCNTEYNKDPAIFIGTDNNNPPAATNMPHIILLPGVKKEGLKKGMNVYCVNVSWGVTDANTTSTGNVTEYNGLYNADAFGQLIWETLADYSTNYPASKVKYEVVGAAAVPLFKGTMTIKIRVPYEMGATITI